MSLLCPGKLRTLNGSMGYLSTVCGQTKAFLNVCSGFHEKEIDDFLKTKSNSEQLPAMPVTNILPETGVNIDDLKKKKSTEL